MEDDNNYTVQDVTAIGHDLKGSETKKAKKSHKFEYLNAQIEVRSKLKIIDTISAIVGLIAIPLEYFQVNLM